MAEEKKAETNAPAAPPAAPAPAPTSGSKVSRMQWRKIAYGALGAMVLFIALYYALQSFGFLRMGAAEYHVHADFKVFLSGNAYNFSQERFMSKETCGQPGKALTLKEAAHLHEGNGNVVHVHKAGITWGDFFWNLGIKFNATCFILDTKERYCDEGNDSIRFFVNGKKSFTFDQEPVRDLDKVLISYGPDNDAETQRELGSVTNDACSYSNKCPERNITITEEEGCGSS